MVINEMLKTYRKMGYDNNEIAEMLKAKFEDTYKEFRKELIEQMNDAWDLYKILETEGDEDNAYALYKLSNDIEDCDFSDSGRLHLIDRNYNV